MKSVRTTLRAQSALRLLRFDLDLAQFTDCWGTPHYAILWCPVVPPRSPPPHAVGRSESRHNAGRPRAAFPHAGSYVRRGCRPRVVGGCRAVGLLCTPPSLSRPRPHRGHHARALGEYPPGSTDGIVDARQGRTAAHLRDRRLAGGSGRGRRESDLLERPAGQVTGLDAEIVVAAPEEAATTVHEAVPGLLGAGWMPLDLLLPGCDLLLHHGGGSNAMAAGTHQLVLCGRPLYPEPRQRLAGQARRSCSGPRSTRPRSWSRPVTRPSATPPTAPGVAPRPRSRRRDRLVPPRGSAGCRPTLRPSGLGDHQRHSGPFRLRTTRTLLIADPTALTAPSVDRSNEGVARGVGQRDVGRPAIGRPPVTREWPHAFIHHRRSLIRRVRAASPLSGARVLVVPVGRPLLPHRGATP